MSKRNSSASIPSSFDWDLWLYCQNVTMEQLRCPGKFIRNGYNSTAVYEKISGNVLRFRALDLIPSWQQFSGQDNEAFLAESFLKNNAKFQNCSAKFSDLKFEI